jgi:ATP-dependent RNA helicase RhlB
LIQSAAILQALTLIREADGESGISMAETHLTSVRFDSFDLDPRILHGLSDAGFSYCTPIQAEALPIALAGRDVAGQAQTGTGKTAAFLLAILQRLLTAEPQHGNKHGHKHDRHHRSEIERASGTSREDESGATAVQDAEDGHRASRAHPRALVVAPTRELAVQIHKDTLALARHTGFRVGLVFGGTGYQQQREDIAAGIDILIGTPGRLIDYFKQHVFSLKSIEAVVLDEADRMFDLGFIKDIRFLIKRMPPPDERLGMLFSATLSYRVLELAYEHMNHPQLVKIESDKVTAERVRQCCYMTANSEKIPLLIGLVRSWEDPRAMVFVNTKREADRVWGYLQGNGINTAVLSGDVPQKKRLSLLKRFTDGDLPVLVGTDVAARGLHIPDVSHVVNYDLPEDAEDYVHRIGRTARAGAEGDAISFVCETYAFCLPDIERFIGAKIPVAHLESDLLVPIDPKSRLRPDREDREYKREGRDSRGGRQTGHRDGSRDSQRRRRVEQPQNERPDAAPGQAESPEAISSDLATTPVESEQSAPAKRSRSRRRNRSAGKESGSAGAASQSADLSGSSPSATGVAPEAVQEVASAPKRRSRRAARPTEPAPSDTPAPQQVVADQDAGAQASGESGDPVKRRRRRRRKTPAGESPQPSLGETAAGD